MDVRLFQVPEADDPWGVFNREVPMYLDLNVMWNPDEKYFATMNLTVPMKFIWAVDDLTRRWSSNLPPVHIVFKGTNCFCLFLFV